MEAKFKIGDVVQLNSGGPLLTVRRIVKDGDRDDPKNILWCTYLIEGDDKLTRDINGVESLFKKADKEL